MINQRKGTVFLYWPVTLNSRLTVTNAWQILNWTVSRRFLLFWVGGGEVPTDGSNKTLEIQEKNRTILLYDLHVFNFFGAFFPKSYRQIFAPPASVLTWMCAWFWTSFWFELFRVLGQFYSLKIWERIRTYGIIILPCRACYSIYWKKTTRLYYCKVFSLYFLGVASGIR